MRLLDQIQAACTPEQIAKRDDAAIAAAVNLIRKTAIASRQIGFGLVLDALGADDGASVLDKIDSLRPSVPRLKYVWILLEKGELDVGLTSVRSGLDELVDVAMTQAQADRLKALAEVSDPVSVSDVSGALNGVK